MTGVAVLAYLRYRGFSNYELVGFWLALCALYALAVLEGRDGKL